MNCLKVRQNLFGYFKRELSFEEIEKIKAHLESCPDCAREAEEVAEVNLMLKDSLETFVPSADFNEKLLAKIHSVSPDVKVIDARKWWQKLLQEVVPQVKLRWALAGAVSVIILAWVIMFTQKRVPIGPESLTQNAKKSKGQNWVSEDSAYRKMLEELIQTSSKKNRAFVIDNYSISPNRGEDGRIQPSDTYKRFVIERSKSPYSRRGNHYVLPVVSTQTASQKIDY